MISPLAAPDSRPSAPVTTCSTCGEPVTHRNTTPHSRAIAAGLGSSLAPAASRSATRSRLRNAVIASGWPLALQVLGHAVAHEARRADEADGLHLLSRRHRGSATWRGSSRWPLCVVPRRRRCRPARRRRRAHRLNRSHLRRAHRAARSSQRLRLAIEHRPCYRPSLTPFLSRLHLLTSTLISSPSSSLLFLLSIIPLISTFFLSLFFLHTLFISLPLFHFPLIFSASLSGQPSYPPFFHYSLPFLLPLFLYLSLTFL